MHYPRAASLILGAIATLACNEQTREPATADSSTSAGVQANRDEMQPASGARTAADEIAEARCHHAKICGKVGPGQDYASLSDCEKFFRTNWKVDLDPLMCPGGINRSHLDECLTEIRGASCSSPMDALERVAACTQREICIEQRD